MVPLLKDQVSKTDYLINLTFIALYILGGQLTPEYPDSYSG
jgi:hypothetical protein